MREQRFMVNVVDRQRGRQLPDNLRSVYNALHRGLRLPAADRCKQSLSADPGLCAQCTAQATTLEFL